MKTATLFGGAAPDRNTLEYKETLQIGEWLAACGLTVKSGGYGGLMEAISAGARRGGGEAIGYTVQTFKNTVGNDYLTQTVVCTDIYDRLRGLIEDTDLFLIQRGGLGTLAELFLTLDVIRKIKPHQRPRVILIGACYHELVRALHPLIAPVEMEMFTVVANFEELKMTLNYVKIS